MQNLPLLERVDLARVTYARLTGKLPTRIVLTQSDMFELAIWRLQHPKEPAIIGPPTTNEAQLYGMLMRVDVFAKELRVYFQES